ncbi:PAP/OAS1 substrate-binding domain-containing protein, partial [Backusella circina FSU 941]
RQLACDLNVNNTLALQNSKMIKTYVAIDPRVRPLAMVIKYWTKRRGINDAGDGGTLSTYTWICMLISFLQTREPPILPNLHETPHTLSKDNLVIHGLNSSFCCENMEGFGSDNHETLGGLLYAFFRKFGYEFDYNRQVVSIRSGSLVSKREHWRDDKLCIEEPFDVRRNLGNSVDEASVKGLQLEFQRAVSLILE